MDGEREWNVQLCCTAASGVVIMLVTHFGMLCRVGKLSSSSANCCLLDCCCLLSSYFCWILYCCFCHSSLMKLCCLFGCLYGMLHWCSLMRLCTCLFADVVGKFLSDTELFFVCLCVCVCLWLVGFVCKLFPGLCSQQLPTASLTSSCVKNEQNFVGGILRG